MAEFPKKLKIAINYRNVPAVPTLLGELQKVLNFSYEPIWFDSASMGMKLENGTWNGIFERIQRRECDIATNFFLKEERTDIMDFGFPHVFTDVTFITSKPTKSLRTFAFVDAFSFQLWIAVLVFYIFFSLVVYRFLQGKESYLDLMMKLFGSLLGQSFSFTFRRTSKRFVFISWIIGVFLLTQTFRNILLSFWSVPSISGIRNIQDLADAVKKGTCIVKTHKNHIFIDMFLQSTSENMRIIGESMLENNDNDLEIREFLLKYKAAFVSERQYLRSLKHQYYLSEESFFSFIYGFGTRKGFCCLEELNKVVLRMLETGIVEKITSRYFEIIWEVKHHLIPTTKSEQETPLNLQDILGALYILLLGYALSLTAFIAEILTHNMKRKRSKRMRQ